MVPEILNLGITDISWRHPLLGNIMAKHPFQAMEMPTTAEVLLSSVLSSQTTQSDTGGVCVMMEH
jgi:hypothetical protein